MVDLGQLRRARCFEKSTLACPRDDSSVEAFGQDEVRRVTREHPERLTDRCRLNEGKDLSTIAAEISVPLAICQTTTAIRTQGTHGG